MVKASTKEWIAHLVNANEWVIDIVTFSHGVNICKDKQMLSYLVFCGANLSWQFFLKKVHKKIQLLHAEWWVGMYACVLSFFKVSQRFEQCTTIWKAKQRKDECSKFFLFYYNHQIDKCFKCKICVFQPLIF